ncbi:PspC domain-containing protein [Streptomyces sp. NPDC051940]|uniref:PspC domain-containing protein n=1 Tax=Streptomyces sp. NPDC051940 TaxID=3155675 RepID=UPI00344304CE
MTATRPAGPAHGEETPEKEAPAVRDRLTRSRTHKVMGGVCAGLGRYYAMDPVIFRVVFGVLAVTGGLGLVAYGMAWLLIPGEGEEENEGRRLLSGRVEGASLTALLVMVVGCGLFLSMLRNGEAHVFTAMLALSLAGACYWSRHRRDVESGAVLGDDATAQAVADAPPETAPPPVPQPPSWWRDPLTKDGPSLYLWGPPDEPYDKAAARAVRSRPVRRERSGIGGVVFVLAVVTGGIVSSATWSNHPLGTSLALGLSCALGVFGLGFAVSSRLGRTGGGTVFWSLTTALLLTVALALPKDVTSEWMDTTWRPASAAEVQPVYKLGTGDATLDLSQVKLAKDQTLEVRAEVSAGRLRVIVPRSPEVRLSSEVSVGDLELPGTEAGKDVDISIDHDRDMVLTPSDREPVGVLDLDLKVSVGQLDVEQAPVTGGGTR